MASQLESDVVAHVLRLIKNGKTFSISIEDPDGPVVEKIRRRRGNNLLAGPCPDDAPPCNGDCIQCVCMPGCGLYCGD
jgi:hypothetical protein